MTIDRIRVMISSRCKDYATVDGAMFPLSRLRLSLQQQIDEAQLFDEQLFKSYVNEREPAKAASRDLWDECLHEVRRAHIVIVLYNGDAGWAQVASDIGICHAELEASLFSGRGRTHLIQLPRAKASIERDVRFQKFVEREQLYSGSPTVSESETITNVRQTLVEAVSLLTRGGAGLLRKDSYALGEALEWSKLDYGARKLTMESACLDALAERQGRLRDVKMEAASVRVRLGKSEVLFFAHAIPAAASVAAARELVGKPFLADHQHIADSDALCGPVHLIACQKSVTERQATDLLGFPDATVVPTTFGVYVVDPVQKIQLMFLSNCRDATSTRFAVQRLFDWLERSGESDALVRRARSRKKIVGAIRRELESHRV